MIDTRNLESISQTTGWPVEHVAQLIGHALANEAPGIEPLEGNPQCMALDMYRQLGEQQERPRD